MDTLCTRFAICAKGHNFCDFLFALLDAKAIVKRGLLWRENSFLIEYKLYGRGQNNFDIIVPFAIVSVPLKPKVNTAFMISIDMFTDKDIIMTLGQTVRTGRGRLAAILMHV